MGTDRAEGRVAAEAVAAPVSLPPFDASAMDGFALRYGDLEGAPPHTLQIVGTSYAGRPWSQPVPPRSAVRIFTGAAIPASLDTVVIQEDCDYDPDAVRIRVTPDAGDNVRTAGHDVQAGERLLPAGTRITAFHLGWMSACGVTRVRVVRRPRVAIFSTGDELVEPGNELGPGQIYDANRHLLRLLLSRLPVQVEDFGILPDDPAHIRAALQRAAADNDAVITSGGVSVGDADWVKRIVDDMGALQFWKLNLKPGKPLAYGSLGNAVFLGLPGNPVSAVVTALLIARPALLRLCGAGYEAPTAVRARLEDAIAHRPGREEFQRGILREQDAELVVAVTGDQSSNRLASFAEANCLIRIPKQSGNLAVGDHVSVLLLTGLT